MGVESFFAEREYQIGQSLRFEDGSSTSLTLTPGTAGNRRTFTFSAWFKRGNVNSSGTRGMLFSAYSDANNYTFLGFDDGGGGYDRLRFYSLTSSSVVIDFESTQQLRDVSAWYHLVVSVDTTQGTSGNRVKIYLNGEQVTAWATSTEPSEDYDTFVSSTVLHSIGSFNNASSYFDGYMTEINFVDGSQLTPSSFAETGTFGEWIPIEYAGAYGDEGFYLTGAGGGLISATGGTITTDGDFKVHSFTSNGTFTPTITGHTESDVEYLVIAGGGGGGAKGGGGGAGGFRTGFEGITSGTGYGITVGAGGAGGTGLSVRGVNGANSVFDSVTSVGGGGGGSDAGVYRNGSDGGSGGGVAGGGYGDTVAGGSATSGQGFDGGNHIASSPYNGGGGGGAGAVGATNGNGGAGLASSITGSSVTRAGGGGGGGDVSGSAGAAGAGGGGAGAGASDTPAAGTVNTGGGGGAGGNGGGHVDGAAGGSGIVIIRYRFQ